MVQTNSILYIDKPQQLKEFCRRNRDAARIGFDTEFVSENRYRPELCLLQAITEDQVVLIDTLKVPELDVFWDLLTQGDHITIAHAAREEFLFCYRASGNGPKNLFDIQLAAGFVGHDYPAAYASLVAQRLGKVVAKGETRTDWKQRPLSDQQLEYAAGDVEYLMELHRDIDRDLKSAGRMSWYQEEMNSWIEGLIAAESQPQWHRISGAARLNRRGLAILQELWILRDRIACKKNYSPRRVIPDDLLIELAKRGSSRPSNFKSIRGFSNRVGRNLTDDISHAIQMALELPDHNLPKKLDRGKAIHLGLVGQFLSIVIGVVCRSQQISPGLVGTNQELRDLAAWRLGKLDHNPVPNLVQGWRSTIVGEVIENALAGKIVLKIDNPEASQPLAIQHLEKSVKPSDGQTRG